MANSNEPDQFVQSEAIRYLCPPPGAFWQWEPSGEAIIWSYGETIVFASELSEILAKQVEFGFPPIGALLLVIAATRDNWSRDPSEMSIQKSRLVLRKILAKRDNAHVTSVVEQLNRLNRFEPELRTSVEAKKVLVEKVFETTRDRTTPAVAAEVILLLQDRFQNHLEDLSKFRSGQSASQTLINDLRTIRFRLPSISPEQLRLRRTTGVDELPELSEPIVELPQREAIRKLLNDWRDDPELGAMARAARQLMSVLTLRRPIGAADDLAQGGVSDITNRGPLDRLLLSELAYDDLTLAVRVAVNESLYLRRELPRKQVHRSRFVVLDSGIRMWGTPRVLATSLAMALGAGLEPLATLVAFSAAQSSLVPVDLAATQGVTDHLATLRHDLHLGRSLAALKQEVQAADGEAEVVLITSPEALEDAEFQQHLIQSKLELLFVATVERYGLVSVFEYSPSGRKLIKRVKIDVEAMAVTKPLIKPNRLTDLPAILAVEPFPLRLPFNGSPDCRWSIGDEGAISVSNDRRLQWWDQHSAYGLQLSTKIRAGQVRWTSRAPINGQWLAVLGSNGEKLRLVRIDLSLLEVTEIPLQIESRPMLGFFCNNGFLYATSVNKVFQLSCETGELVCDEISGLMAWRGDRFFFDRAEKSWNSLTDIQDGLSFDKISFSTPSQMITQVFESPSVEGPIGVGIDGSLNFSCEDKLQYVNHSLGERVDVEAISSDGRQIKLCVDSHSTNPTLGRSVIVDVPSGNISGNWNQEFTADNQRDRLIRSGPIRNRFRAIGVHGRNTLCLASRRGTCWNIACVNGDLQLRKVENAIKVWHSNSAFESMPKNPEFRFRLQVASWSDGSKAWLDSRGLLHLRSSNLDIPEISIVLSEKPSGGWCSIGNVFGPKLYGGATTSGQQVFDDVVKAFAKHVVFSC